ncbi:MULTISPECIES: LysR family transcriptional regulator [Metabacillus]|jgi:DNA-binding transcriptional LysR family regulator|uniref:LysR family transcriptional regulator n=1 Tax=Metabacillus rhizolycopersici TaxID=2875709 RepID=A0ABS7UUZ8_9BACI|nr:MULTISPECIES: LysR family transcriptional regulator [Metabacillus]MBZ5752135.1 LysR family transcriptional regulator [Metabacillus rhizolycopersici]MCM3654428.1 LysR family transcriptional regulator [Metabacillus litoralis]
MELRDIKSFIGVADHKSFTKAAEHSYLSQPSLSKAVKKLEDELHVELFDRSTRYLRLTDAGQIVYTQGKKTLAALTELTTLLDELTDGEAGEIKMGVPPLIGTLFFPKIARLFHEQYPNVTLELIEMGAKIIEQLVKEGQIDVGLIVLPVDETAFNIYPFITDDFVLYVHQDHPLARKNAVSLSELKDEKFIVFSEHFSLHDHIINACKEAGFTPSISYESSQWDLILELVASKLGIALLPNSIFEKQNNPSIKTIPLQAPSLLWKLGVITKKESYHSFALRRLLEIIKKDLN